ncbi:hypothetical protein BG011_002002, partial [Mortierella polycephala]
MNEFKDGQVAPGQVELSQELIGHSKELKELKELKVLMVKNIRLTEQELKEQKKVHKLQEALSAKQEEIKQLQIQGLGQLAVLQSRVQAYPSGWDVLQPFTHKYRLYFLCECGEHTKSINSKSKIPHHIHLAKHEGYEIARPSEFFQQYGPYVLTILKMLKFGVTVAGVAMPALSQLVSPDFLGQTIAGLKELQDNIVPGADQVINWMDKVSMDDGEGIEGATEHKENKEALEGADLRKLETFLRRNDGNKVLGNLYRTVTDEGHVKWVCIDHYRENYQENAVKEFRRMLESVGGSFDENVGRVEVKLRSRGLAEEFCSALGKAKSVQDLDICLDWACSKSDLEVLEEALKKSRASIFRLELRQFQTSLGSKVLSTPPQCGVLFRIIELPNMKVIHIVLPKGFAKLSSLQSKKPAHLHKLSIEMVVPAIVGKEVRILADTLKTNSTLITLNLDSNLIGFSWFGDNGALALSEALKTNSTLITLRLSDNSIGSNGALALSEALKTNSTLTTLYLSSNSIGDNGALALSEALKTNSTLITLNLYYNSIGSNGALALSEALKTNSTLSTLELSSNRIGYNGALALSEARKTTR